MRRPLRVLVGAIPAIVLFLVTTLAESVMRLAERGFDGLLDWMDAPHER